MLIDEAFIIFRAGHGGPGKVSFYPGEKAGPDGGNGGRGGDVYLIATSDLTALRPYTSKKVKAAENGSAGQSFLKSGHDGKDLEVILPVGTVLTDQETGKVTELTTPGQKVLFCTGGLGGRGNYEFRSSRRTTPEFAQPGLPGEEKACTIQLKLIAQYGLIGLPNAGKSSLLNELTAANVKVANYPFTTLEPNLGTLPNSRIIADIPGLIEGASGGKGLGIKFLKHIEKVEMLLHCISAESDNPEGDYKTIRNELKLYNPELLEKPELILLTKSDTQNEKGVEKIIKSLKKLNPEVITVSIHNFDQIESLKKYLSKPALKRAKCAGGVVLNGSKVAIVNQYGETWSLPRGHVEEDEEMLDAAKREIYEETGLAPENLEFVKELGTFERPSLGGKRFQKEPEIKVTTMFLFKTNELELRPIDPNNPEAIWVEIAKAAGKISNKKDAEFFESIIGML